MKISLQWLADYLPGLLDATEAAEAFTRGGLPVEVIERIGPDTVLDVEVTSNRGDCLSHVGAARELSALLDRPWRDVQTPPLNDVGPVAADVVRVSIDPSADAFCPQYVARVIRDVKVGPSPDWLVRRLSAVGLRSVNNVVDITNYVMFELGQPLHAFDLNKLSTAADGKREVIVRLAKAGERLTSIDGKARELLPSMLVIADAQLPVALAGVMGGKESEVAASTTDVLLESARFDPLIVRGTARKLAMASDSSYRYERGIDPAATEKASRRAAQLIAELAGGCVTGGWVASSTAGPPPRELLLRPATMKRLLGVEWPTAAIVAALDRLNFAPREAAGGITVAVPSYRLDVNIEADLVEEVARVAGYDKIPTREQIAITVVPPQPERRAMDLLRDALVAAGFFEAVTFSFVTDALAKEFLPPGTVSLPRVEAAVRKADARLRPSILPGLLETMQRNEYAGNGVAKFFEAGSVFRNANDDHLEERRQLGIVGSADYRALRGAIESALGSLDAARPVAVRPHASPRASFAVSGDVTWGDAAVGIIGMVDQRITSALGIAAAPAAAELDLPLLLAGYQPVPQLRPVPRYPAIRRDLSLILPDAVPYADVERIVREVKPAFLEDVEYVTTYRGKPLEKGSKSVTLQLVFRSPTGTLAHEQADAGVQDVVSAARLQLKASLRT